MAHQNVHTRKPRGLWPLVRRQHGVVTRAQLLELGFTPQAVVHRLARGRLHPVWRGVYATGRPELSREGIWMAAVLSCGREAALSHGSAAALWGISIRDENGIEVSVPARLRPRRHGIVVHRRRAWEETDVTRRDGIPVTSPIRTLVDLATRVRGRRLEAAINEADKLDLVDPETLRSVLAQMGREAGTGVLRKVLDRRTFTLTESDLERRFVDVACRAGLPMPQTGSVVNGFKVDFHWPELLLVVETDGLRYHRTPSQQARDRRRDQAHAAAGTTCLRFTHAQVVFEEGDVKKTLAAVARRLSVARRVGSTPAVRRPG